MAGSKTPVLDTRLLELPGASKVVALMEAKGVTRKDVVRRAGGGWGMEVTRILRGEGRPNPQVQDALAELLELPVDELTAALVPQHLRAAS